MAEMHKMVRSNTDIPILKVEHLSMQFGGLIAINDLSFEAKRGEITAVIGPNGAGKTTVFNCLTGFYKPTGGMVTLEHSNGTQFLLERLPDFIITQKARVARTFQNIRLFSGLTVLENLLVAQHNPLMRSSGYTILGLLGLPAYKRAEVAAVESARFWLDKINLTDRADDFAGDLPYGDQRRLEIARAMCTQPELLCLDEPAAGLNPRESADLNRLLINIKEELKTSILLIEHDMSVVMEISDHVIVLEYGTKISDGKPDFVRNDPKVIAAYLGVEDEEMDDLLGEQGAGDVNQPLASDTVVDTLVEQMVKEGTQSSSSASTAISGISGALTIARNNEPDNLTLIKGIGSVNEKKLHEHGIFHFDQIAAWTAEDIKAVEEYLSFDGRIEREEWVTQATQLAAGIQTEFSQRVEAGQVHTSHQSDGATQSNNKTKTNEGGE